MIKILDAINIIHEKKIIHCDLKPQNIFVDKKYNIKIIDFETSIINGNKSLYKSLSLNYCSPEQINKERINNQTDIFSLGIVLYQLIVGKVPFDRKKEGLYKDFKYDEIEKIKNDNLNYIFLKAVNKNLDYRYKSAKEFRKDLIKFLVGKRDYMNENFKKYLPIGTVVMLKGGSKRLMITGFCSVANDDKNKVYDYSGCMYPEGFLSSDQTALFNHDQIDKIYYMGLSDDEDKKFKENLNLLISKLNNQTNES